MTRWFSLFLTLAIVTSLAAAESDRELQTRADRCLDLVNASYKALYRVQSEAQWDASTDVTPAHDAASETAAKASAAFNGNPAVIKEAKELLSHRAQLAPMTVREIERVILNSRSMG